jgi:signal transduction histidine kinase
LPAAVDLAAYRIVQEALTNVHKHAHTDVARLAVGFDGAEVRIVVDNDGRADAPITNGTGHGMLGMRERATAVGGSLSAGQQPDGGFRVEAVLPVKGGTLSWS